jgi:hypothetical protein
MKVKTKCQHCGKVYQMDESFLGQTAQCRNCQQYFTMTPFEDQPASAPHVAPGPPTYGPPPAQPQVQPPAYGQTPAQPAAAPAYGQGTPGQPSVNNQTVVCPKCRYTADVPRVSRKLKLTCQECGHKFVVKPESRPGRPLPTEKAPKEGGSSNAPALILLLLLLGAGVLVAGPKLFPEIIPDLLPDLGLPDLSGLLDLLPF